MQYWLVKTEPNCWSWAQQVKDDVTCWDDVKNPEAQKNMRAMQEGDLAFFYHTGNERCILGTVTIVRTAYPDPSDDQGRRCMVDVQTNSAFKTPVTLKMIKEDPRLAHLALVKRGRLSVAPIDQAAWQLICSWGV